jgi:hypothetical protein
MHQHPSGKTAPTISPRLQEATAPETSLLPLQEGRASNQTEAQLIHHIQLAHISEAGCFYCAEKGRRLHQCQQRTSLPTNVSTAVALPDSYFELPHWKTARVLPVPPTQLKQPSATSHTSRRPPKDPSPPQYNIDTTDSDPDILVVNITPTTS